MKYYFYEYKRLSTLKIKVKLSDGTAEISKIDYFDPFRSVDYSTKQIGDSDFNDFHLFE